MGRKKRSRRKKRKKKGGVGRALTLEWCWTMAIFWADLSTSAGARRMVMRRTAALAGMKRPRMAGL